MANKSIVEEAKESVKNKKKEENKMKTQSIKEAVKTWTIIILVGLIVTASSSAYFFFKGAETERQKFEAIKSEAKELTEVAKKA